MAGIDALLVLALQHRMAGDQPAVLEDAHLGRVVLDLDDPAPGRIRNAVLIAADGDHAFVADPALDGQDRVIGPAWQSHEMRLLLHKMLVDNPLRGGMAEFGIVVTKGIHNLDRLIAAAQDVPAAARPALDVLAGQLRDLEERIDEATLRITAAQKVDPIARRLATVPGLGPIASSAFAATTPDVGAFRSARDVFAGKTVHRTVF